VRVVETEGKKTYHITPEGEAFLEQHRDTIDEIFSRVRDTVRDVAGGVMGDLSHSFARLAALAYKDAWGHGPNDPTTRRIVEILDKAAEEIRALRSQPTA